MTSIGSTKLTSASGTGLVVGNNAVLNGASNSNAQPTEILSIDVPEGKIWQLQYAEVICRGWGKWKAYVDNVVCGGGDTNPGNSHDRTDFPDSFDIPSGSNIKVIYWYSNGPNNMPIDSFIGILEF